MWGDEATAPESGERSSASPTDTSTLVTSTEPALATLLSAAAALRPPGAVQGGLLRPLRGAPPFVPTLALGGAPVCTVAHSGAWEQPAASGLSQLV